MLALAHLSSSGFLTKTSPPTRPIATKLKENIADVDWNDRVEFGSRSQWYRYCMLPTITEHRNPRTINNDGGNDDISLDPSGFGTRQLASPFLIVSLMIIHFNITGWNVNIVEWGATTSEIERWWTMNAPRNSLNIGDDANCISSSKSAPPFYIHATIKQLWSSRIIPNSDGDVVDFWPSSTLARFWKGRRLWIIITSSKIVWFSWINAISNDNMIIKNFVVGSLLIESIFTGIPIESFQPADDKLNYSLESS